jgi:hypothetical protein
MKLRYLQLALLLLFVGCAAYKQLKPKPEISFIENGYIELKNGDKYFELKKDKKYFITFPAPQANDFYLVLQLNEKSFYNSYLTNQFDDGKGIIVKIEDKAPPEENLSVYPISKSVQNFYWVIDFVRQDMDLLMDYRYVSQWRYSFENKHSDFQAELEKNRVDREVFNSIGSGFNFSGFNFQQEIAKVETRNKQVQTLQNGLSGLEAIFPPNILNTQDEAYLDFLTLKQNIESENRFQKQYLNVLRLFQVERGTQADMKGFVEALPGFIDFFETDTDYPENVVKEAGRILDARLSEVPSYYEEQLENKQDANPVDFNIDEVEALYNAMKRNTPDRFQKLAAFIRSYNEKSNALLVIKKKVNDLESSVKNLGEWPSNTYFSGVQQKLSNIAYGLPKASFSGHGKYANYRCVGLLDQAIGSTRGMINRLLNGYRQADAVVPEINRYLAAKNYSQAIRAIKANADLGFLTKIYANLDELSLNAQKSAITTALTNQNWREAEAGLRSLHLDKNFLNTSAYITRKNSLVKSMEDTLLARVERVTKQRVNRFVEENYTNLNGVEAMYQNPVFEPAWDITFTSGSRQQLDQRKKALADRLKYLKDVAFPEKAIDRLYRDFSSDISNNGVLKARAIVSHGKNYKGNNSKTKNLVAECDPFAAKWLTKAKDYRKLYVLPVTTNNSGENEYRFRVKLKIPSDADFPVYDVNVKIPKEVAVGSARAQWYDQMTMNNKVLKNEGRFTITAPTYKNDYECQITPLSIDKGGENILEVRFKHPAFKVFEISVMAQKPIIRKN